MTLVPTGRNVKLKPPRRRCVASPNHKGLFQTRPVKYLSLNGEIGGVSRRVLTFSCAELLRLAGVGANDK